VAALLRAAARQSQKKRVSTGRMYALYAAGSMSISKAPVKRMIPKSGHRFSEKIMRR
jgi:hypothetical protein